MDKAFQQQQATDDPARPRQLIRVMPRYVRLRQGSEIRYHIKLSRPPSKVHASLFEARRPRRLNPVASTQGKGVTIHVCVIMNKCGITATPSQLVIIASDWRTPREVVVSSEPDSQLRTIQIHHKIYETYDDVYNSSLVIPSLFVSVLQKEATFLFAFGCGMHGRLGTNSEENALAPAPFSCKWMHPVQIACGKAHSAIIDVYSNIYCFGLGTSGQLGQGDANLDASRIPLRVPSIGAVPVLLVACGSYHTMCMTAEGRVFAWGDNSYGQLGIGSKSSKPRGTPTRVDKIAGVRAIVCGGCHSFIVTQDNVVLASGSNVAGQLGLGDRVDRVHFERVPFFRRLLSSSTAAVASSALSVSTISSNNASDGGFTIPDLLLRGGGRVRTVSLARAVRQASLHLGQRGRRASRSWHCRERARADASEFAAGRSHPLHRVRRKPQRCDRAQRRRVHVGQRPIRTTGRRVGACSTSADESAAATRQGRSAALVRRVALNGALPRWLAVRLGLRRGRAIGSPGRRPEGIPTGAAALADRPVPMIVHSLSGTGATSVRCGGSHTFVVSVLENRRQHLARLQQQVSQSEIRSESRRLREHRQTRVLQGSPLSFGRSVVLPTHQANTSAINRDDETEHLSQRRSSKTSKGKARSPSSTCHSARDDVERERELERARSFSWKDRPLTSRTAVRNALRKEAREFLAVKDMLAELSSTSSRPLTPSCSRPTTRGNDRTHRTSASTFVSPRLARLQKQVDRATEAGAARLKCEEIVGDDTTASAIRTAVQDATRDCLLGGNDTIQCDIEPERRRRRLAGGDESSDVDSQGFRLDLLLNALTELEGGDDEWRRRVQ